MDSTVQFFCGKGIAESTQKTYQSALRRFGAFCSQFAVLTPFPVSESLLCYFASFLAKDRLSPKTIKIYLAGIRHMQITLGLPEPKEFSSLPRLRLVQAGIQRTHSQRAPVKERVRLPITPEILGKLKSHWWRGGPSYDNVMLWAASTLCFYGFFRAGEITVPSLNGFDASCHLAWGDIAVDNSIVPRVLKVHLKKSKTDQLGKGIDIFIGRTDELLCPVEAFTQYVIRRGSSAGCFFIFSNQEPLTKTRFVAKVREALQAVGLPCDKFAGHSFRIGAATTAAKVGVEDSVIRMLGRWNSAAFLSYVRTPREQLSEYSRLLARK